MAQRFFYISGGVFFAVATVLLLRTSLTAGRQFVGLQYAQGGLVAITANGDQYVGAADHWKFWGNIRSATKGDPLGIR